MRNNARKESVMTMLKRWMALDRELSCPSGLHIASFRKRFRKGVNNRGKPLYVTTQTIHRDLAALKKLGQKFDNAVRDSSTGKYYHRYKESTKPLFVATVDWLRTSPFAKLDRVTHCKIEAAVRRHKYDRTD